MSKGKGIKEVLISRDGITPDQADSLINQALEAMDEYFSIGDIDSAENVCEEFFGLEPDYIDELV